MDQPEIALTESETARLLNISLSGLRKWRRKNVGPSYVRLGRLIRYRMSEIQVWLDSHAVKSQKEEDHKAALTNRFNSSEGSLH